MTVGILKVKRNKKMKITCYSVLCVHQITALTINVYHGKKKKKSNPGLFSPAGQPGQSVPHTACGDMCRRVSIKGNNTLFVLVPSYVSGCPQYLPAFLTLELCDASP